MKNILILSFLLTVFGTVLAQEYSVRGKVLLNDTGASPDSAIIYIQSPPRMVTTETFYSEEYILEEAGDFTFEGLGEGEYLMTVEVPGYHTAYHYLKITEESDQNIQLEITAWPLEGENGSPAEHIERFDTMHVGFAFRMFSTDLGSGFSSNRTFQYGFAFKRPVNRFLQLGLEPQLALNWTRLKDDVTATPVIYDMERYFSVNYSIVPFARFILSHTNDGLIGTFVDLGAGYDFPLYFRYAYKDENGDKVRAKKIVNYTNFYAKARVGYRYISLVGTYRFSDIMKDGYPEPPRVNLGLEFIISGY